MKKISTDAPVAGGAASMFLAFFVAVLFAGPASAQQDIRERIKIEMDFRNAKSVLSLFDGTSVNETELARLFELHGTNATVEKVSQFEASASPELYRATLKRVVETGEVEFDPFRFKLVKSRLPQVRELLRRIEQDPDGLADAVRKQISAYTGEELRMSVTVHFLLGGSSNAFAAGDKHFYVGLHYFGDDYDGLKQEMAHELFHNAQAALKLQRPRGAGAPHPPNVVQSVRLLDRFVDEATAVLAGDPERLKGDGTFSKFYQGLIAKNDARMQSNFALFELQLFRLHEDPSLPADYFDQKVYNIGLTGFYDSPFYIMGYRMAQAIEKHKGRGRIRELVGKSPTLFFKDYIEIYNGRTDPSLIRFTGACERILLKLAREAA